MKRKQPSDAHSYPSLKRDVEKMVQVLKEEKVFIPVKTRQHSAFATMKCGIMQKHTRSILVKKVRESLTKII